ncbi:MAG: arsenical resistance protein ArsH [Gammaproteobacteria bacterium]|nr:MAG: arsenical resistance protein ArsH [Gammaproteobacteria bacterium]
MKTLYPPRHSVADTLQQLAEHPTPSHAPRFLLLYGSLREESYSRKLALEAAKILQHFGAEVKIFDPTELPIFDRLSYDHPKVKELHALAQWCEGMVWSSPEIHGNLSSVIKNQIDWIPLSLGSVRPTQGRTLAVMQVSGGSQSFNAVNSLRILGRWMRMLTIPNQSSVAKAYEEFNDDGSMKDSAYRDRVVDVMEELFRFTLLVRGHTDFLTYRYSENKDDYQARVGDVAAAALEEEKPVCKPGGGCC